MKTIRLPIIIIVIGILLIACDRSAASQPITTGPPTVGAAAQSLPTATNLAPPTTIATIPPAAGIENSPEPDIAAANPFLDQVAEDTWAYLSSEWARSNHLPWSWRSETMTGGDFANTAEIGFLALSWLAAYDMAAPWSPMWSQCEAEVVAILDQLRAWQTGSQPQQPNGPNAYNNSVFYQWYWISPNPPVVSGNPNDHLVPSIDNAWLAASLIMIREYAVAHGYPTLQQKADAILEDMDFRFWYHPDTYLFSWGDMEDPSGDFLADYYSNENRIVNFVARALGQLSAEEYEASLAALVTPEGSYGGITVEAMAWDGSYFTYAAPALFIRELATVYSTTTIVSATEAQIAYAADQGYEAWGLSDCFDVGTGGYVQQGAPPSGLIPPETRPGLVSPHASAMAMLTPLATQAITNLQTIANTYSCAYHSQYGFYDSVMTNPNAPDFGQCSYRFSTLNQEWIFLSLVNENNGFIWHYFYNHAGVQQAHAEMFNEFALFLPNVLR